MILNFKYHFIATNMALFILYLYKLKLQNKYHKFNLQLLQ